MLSIYMITYFFGFFKGNKGKNKHTGNRKKKGTVKGRMRFR